MIRLTVRSIWQSDSETTNTYERDVQMQTNRLHLEFATIFNVILCVFTMDTFEMFGFISFRLYFLLSFCFFCKIGFNNDERYCIEVGLSTFRMKSFKFNLQHLKLNGKKLFSLFISNWLLFFCSHFCFACKIDAIRFRSDEMTIVCLHKCSVPQIIKTIWCKREIRIR